MRADGSHTLPTEVAVRATARLHLGFLDVAGSLGRKFGSLGLSLSAPEVRVRASLAPARENRSPGRAARYAEAFYAHPHIASSVGGAPRACVRSEAEIPPHRGLGSGTQLALCVVHALCALHGIPCTPEGAAGIAGRGLRSGIGIETFRSGGFVVDAGSETPGRTPPLPIWRCDFPEGWRIVLAQPPTTHPGAGLNGKDEELAFAGIPTGPEAGREICHLTLMRLLPALLERRIDRFGEAVERIQQITGSCFATHQSGLYASPMAEEIFAVMRGAGGYGMGQSSWGPTLYCFAPDARDAAAIAATLRGRFPAMEVAITQARNAGAEICKA